MPQQIDIYFNLIVGSKQKDKFASSMIAIMHFFASNDLQRVAQIAADKNNTHMRADSIALSVSNVPYLASITFWY